MPEDGIGAGFCFRSVPIRDRNVRRQLEQIIVKTLQGRFVCNGVRFVDKPRNEGSQL